MPITPKKRFGQNFLINKGVQQHFLIQTKKLIQQFAIKSIVEIGPGKGAITQHLATLPIPTIALEMDREAIEYINGLPWSNNIILKHCDALEFFQSPQDLTDTIIVSNLPYNVGSRILIEITLQDSVPPWICVLQKEVMNKLLKNEQISVFGAWLKLFWDFTKIVDIAPGSFFPSPKVTSTMVSATPKSIPDFAKTRATKKSSLTWLKILTTYPSKTLTNNLKKHMSASEIATMLDSLNLSPQTRLDYNNYQSILHYLYSHHFVLQN